MGYSGGINPTAQKVPATYCGFEFFVLPLGQAIRCKGVNRVAVCVNVGNLQSAATRESLSGRTTP
ncbi:hypothetical protein GMD48_19060 [Proteus mirabilis]|nr:hypothetical protein [Proteus mirabilis]DAN77600.1 MAG TPA: hypothetical protein [Microviridae sp.]